MENNLILRVLTSPYNDNTRGSVLNHEDVDGNFIYLKGNLIKSGTTQNNNLLLQSLNGEIVTIPLDFTGTTTGGTSIAGISALTFDTHNTIILKDTTGGTFTALVNYLSGLTVTGSVMNGSGITASGNYSHAEGFGSIASGQYSHAEGQSTSATTQASHAEGQATKATAQGAHAEGNATTASGQYSHSEGTGTIASGLYSHTEGSTTIASGFSSHAEGFITIAGGPYTHTEGSATTATGNYSHAEGALSLAIGAASHAEGVGTVAEGDYQSVLGRYNTLGNTTSIFVIGNGTSNTNRSDLALFNSTGITFNSPLKFISGSTYLTPQNGAVEFDGNHFYGTVGTTRYQLDNQINVTAVTTNYNILSSDTGKFFTNEGTTTGMTFTLPNAVKNLIFTFIAENSNAITVSAQTGNTITLGSNITSNGGVISTTDSGSSITLVAINSTKWITISFVGTWII